MDQSYPHSGVTTVTVDRAHAGQRIDNFLVARLKGVPKSCIYRIIRKGEVRVNRRRVKPTYKLAVGDAVRIPPLRTAAPGRQAAPSVRVQALIREAVLYEDENLLVLNKPSGLPVHGGTGITTGLIEALRQCRDDDFLELVHRLDKGTSGCLMVARDAGALKWLGNEFRHGRVTKRYHAVVCGHWPDDLTLVDAALLRRPARGGERFVSVSRSGKQSRTHFRVLRRFGDYTLVEARPETGRTHQIRVHAMAAGHPVAGDEKYSGPADMRRLKRLGITRLCLHAAELAWQRPEDGRPMEIQAPWDDRLEKAVALLAGG